MAVDGIAAPLHSRMPGDLLPDPGALVSGWTAARMCSRSRSPSSVTVQQRRGDLLNAGDRDPFGLLACERMIGGSTSTNGRRLPGRKRTAVLRFSVETP